MGASVDDAGQTPDPDTNVPVPAAAEVRHLTVGLPQSGTGQNDPERVNLNVWITRVRALRRGSLGDASIAFVAFIVGGIIINNYVAEPVEWFSMLMSAIIFGSLIVAVMSWAAGNMLVGEKLRTTDPTAHIRELQQMSDRMTEIASTVEDQLEARRKALEELKTQNDLYENLISLNEGQAESVARVVTRGEKAQRVKQRVESWIQVLAGALLGIVGTLLLQAWQSRH